MNPAAALKRSNALISWEKAAAVVLLLLGAVLRIRQYLTGRSLWADEAMLALNVVNRGFGGMFQPLDHDQGAPIGFLLVEKLFNAILGRNELALRLFPFLMGIASLGLFYLLLRQVTNRAGLLTALALFAFNPRLIYYSSEVKQYIVDVAVATSLLLIAAPLLRRSPPRQGFAWLGIAGLVALWFSHPAVFVLAGIGLALIILYFQRRDYSGLRLVIGIGILWALEITFLYFLILHDLSQNAYMREYWQGAFLPMPPWSEPGWFLRAIDENIRVQFGMPYGAPFIFALTLAGWVILFFQNRAYAVIFASIFLITLMAAAFQLYPVFERMILFLVPIGFVLLGKVMEALQQNLRRYSVPGTAVTLLLAGFLVYGPLMSSVQTFIEPKYFEHIRPTMERLRQAWKDGDALFVSNGALPAFQFYALSYGLEDIPYQSGRREDYKNPQNILSQFDSFKGRSRVWILLSHVYERGDFNEREFILDYLDQTGEKRREFRLPGTSVFLYLYDLEG